MKVAATETTSDSAPSLNRLHPTPLPIKGKGRYRRPVGLPKR